MRTRKITIALTSVIIIALCAGMVSALLPEEGHIAVTWLDQSIQRAETVNISITFANEGDEQLVIERLGLHFDWMEEGFYKTYDLSSNPVTIPAGGNYAFNSISIQIDPYVTSGPHTYYVALDGKEGTDLTSFGWNSEELTMEIAASSSMPTATPTTNPNGNGGGGGGGSSPDLLLIVAVIAVVVIVVLVVVVLMMRRKLKQATAPAASNPVSPV